MRQHAALVKSELKTFQLTKQLNLEPKQNAREIVAHERVLAVSIACRKQRAIGLNRA